MTPQSTDCCCHTDCFRQARRPRLYWLVPMAAASLNFHLWRFWKMESCRNSGKWGAVKIFAKVREKQTAMLPCRSVTVCRSLSNLRSSPSPRTPTACYFRNLRWPYFATSTAPYLIFLNPYRSLFSRISSTSFPQVYVPPLLPQPLPGLLMFT